MNKYMKYMAILIVAVIAIIIAIPKPQLKINTNEIIYYNAGDACVVEYYDYKSEAGLFTTVDVSDDVDCNKIGDYFISYEVSRFFKSNSYTQQVKIIDNEAPKFYYSTEEEIELNSRLEPYLFHCDYEYPAYSVVDNYDDEVDVYRVGSVNTCNPGEYNYKYVATDSSGNSSEAKFKVTIMQNPDGFIPKLNEQRYIVTKVLNVRASYNTSSEIVDVVKFGEKFETLDYKYDFEGRPWYKIAKGDIEGYIAAWLTVDSNVDLDRYHFIGNYSEGDMIEKYTVINVDVNNFPNEVIGFTVKEEHIINSIDVGGIPNMKFTNKLLEKDIYGLIDESGRGVNFELVTFTTGDDRELHKFLEQNKDNLPLAVFVEDCFYGAYIFESDLYCSITSARVIDE